jgi:cytochrome P450
MFFFVLSVENVSIAIGITLLSLYYIFLRETRKLPPTTKHNLFELLPSLTDGNVASFTLQCMKDNGPVFRLALPQLAAFVVVCDPELARKVFEEEDEKPELYKKLDALNKGGVSTIFTKSTHGDDHYKVRKCLAPSFSISNIFSSLPKLHEKLDFVKKIFLQNEKENRNFDAAKTFARLLLDMLCTAMFDVDYHTLEDENGEGRKLMDDFHTTGKEMSKQLANPLRNWMFWNKEQRAAKAASARIYQSSKKLLDNYRIKNTPEEIENGVSIMAHLLKTPYKSDIERCADMSTFISAGHDTSSNSVAWCVVEVAKQPHIYQKIKAEIDSVIGKDIEHMTQQHLAKLVYLDNVIKESMRLNPVAAQGSARKASKDIKFQDMIIPKGSMVSMPQYSIFRMGIQDPESFNPERWNSNSPDLEQLKMSFLPFALGRRNCIGQNLATFEMKLVLATLFRSFRFELQTVVEKECFIVLKPKNALLKVISV